LKDLHPNLAMARSGGMMRRLLDRLESVGATHGNEVMKLPTRSMIVCFFDHPSSLNRPPRSSAIVTTIRSCVTIRPGEV
jgi:hypothetical protein